MFEYHVTESGFAADIGFEKFWNVKCRHSRLRPNASARTTTIQALKMHIEGPSVSIGLSLPEEYSKENLELVEKGTADMLYYIGIICQSGINPVVASTNSRRTLRIKSRLYGKLPRKQGPGVRFPSIGPWPEKKPWN